MEKQELTKAYLALLVGALKAIAPQGNDALQSLIRQAEDVLFADAG